VPSSSPTSQFWSNNPYNTNIFLLFLSKNAVWASEHGNIAQDDGNLAMQADPCRYDPIVAIQRFKRS